MTKISSDSCCFYRFVRLQLEAFFAFVLLRVANLKTAYRLQEVAPTFVFEVYVNYDCDPLCRNIFQQIGKTLCKHACISRDEDSISPGPVQIKEYVPFWEEKSLENLENWVEYVRIKKLQKKKITVAGHHFNRDENKGLEYLKLSKVITSPRMMMTSSTDA